MEFYHSECNRVKVGHYGCKLVLYAIAHSLRPHFHYMNNETLCSKAAIRL